MQIDLLELNVANQMLELMRRFNISPSDLTTNLINLEAVRDFEIEQLQRDMDKAKLTDDEAGYSEAQDIKSELDAERASFEFPHYRFSFVIEEGEAEQGVSTKFQKFFRHLESNITQGVTFSGFAEGEEMRIDALKLSDLSDQLAHAIARAPSAPSRFLG